MRNVRFAEIKVVKPADRSWPSASIEALSAPARVGAF